MQQLFLCCCTYVFIVTLWAVNVTTIGIEESIWLGDLDTAVVCYIGWLQSRSSSLFMAMSGSGKLYITRESVVRKWGKQRGSTKLPNYKIGSALIIKETRRKGYKRSNCSMRWKQRILRCEQKEEKGYIWVRVGEVAWWGPGLLS